MPSLIRTLSFLALALGSCVLSQAQTTYPGAPDTTATLGKAVDHAETKLSAPATDTATVFSVDDATKFTADAFVTFCIGAVVPGVPCTDSGEIARVSASSGTAPGTITVSTRNIAGSTAQNHATGDTVHCTVSSPYHNFLVDAIAATQAKLDTMAGGGAGYSTLLVDGTAVTQRAKFELDAGTGCTLTPTDDSIGGISKTSISCPGGAGYGIQVDGVAQTAEPTISFDHGTGISLTPSIASSVLHIAVAASGSGAGNKTAYAVFPAAGCTGSNVGSAIDLPATGGPTPINHNGSTLILCTDDFTSGTNQSAQISFPLPGDWTASSTVGLQLNWFSSVGSGSTVWTAKTICVPSTSTVLTGTIAWNATSTVTTANPVTPVTRTASVFSGIAATGCFAGGEMWIHIQRTDSATGTVSLKSASVAIQRTY